jgi:predicted nucleotidyltransferase
MPTDFINLFSTLTASGVRFVLVGGLACVMHGVDRTTADVDVMFDLAADPTRTAMAALTKSGYRPMAPVNPSHLADPAIRGRWQSERGMQVFSLWDSENRRPTLDILLHSIVPFDELWRDAVAMTLRGVTVKVASIAHLISLKEYAARPQDLADIARLRQIADTLRQP